MNYAETAYESIYSATDIQQVDDFLLHDERFDVALLDKTKSVIFSSPKSFKFKFKKSFSTYKNHFYYIKTTELDQIKHVHYLLIRSKTIDEQLTNTKEILSVVLLFSILFFSIVIFILSKLFLKPLRQYIEILDNFIRDATHELNTPISVLSMSLERITKDELSFKNQKAFRHIEVATKTLSHLYSDLTFFMFPSPSYSDKHIQLNKLVLQRIDYFSSIAAKKNITVTTSLQQCSVIINEHVISKIIDNLLSNAIKYNKRGGKIDIRLDTYSLIVSDSGIGFDNDFSDVIFDRYKRLKNSNGGFGLGLSIVKSLCELYNITIDAKSQKGEGSTFTLSWKSSRIVHTH